MKFTHYLLKNLVPEWIKLYLNFKFLKTHLAVSTHVKKLLRKAKKQKDRQTYEQFRREIVENSELVHKLERDRNQYVEIFDDECEKIISFAQWKYKDLLVQFEALRKQISFMLQLQKQTKETKVVVTWHLRSRQTLLLDKHDKRMELSEFLQKKAELLDSCYKFYIASQQLKEYISLNSEGIRKILKKYKKQELKGIRDKMLENQYFGRVQSLQKQLSKYGKKLESLKDDVEKQMIIGYYSDDPSLCRTNLRRYTGHKELRSFHIFLFGFFGGAAFVMILVIFAMRYDGLLDPNSDKVFNKIFPCFRGMALFLTYYWFLSLDLAAWNYFNIDYKLYLGFNYHFSTVSEVLGRVSVFTAIYLVIFVWYCIAVEESLGDLSYTLHFVDVRYMPLIIWLIMIIYVFYPTTKYFNPEGRNWMYRMFKGALWGHFVKYESRFTFFTDQFTSMITGMRDVDYTFCYYYHLIAYGQEHHGECQFQKRFTAAQAAIIPYFLKCIQYITRARDKGKYLWTDEMWNFIKTFIAMSVGIMAFVVRLDRSFLYYWIALAIICSTYENWWDLKKDFMLFETNTKHKFLRNDLGYNKPAIYYSLCVVNFFLRIAWVLTISPDMYKVLGIKNELFIMFFGFIEMSRRLVNNFLKMEKEHITNLRNLRTVQELKFPFKEPDVEMIDIQQDPYSESLTPIPLSHTDKNIFIYSPQDSLVRYDVKSRRISNDNLNNPPLIEEISRVPSQLNAQRMEVLLSIPRNISFQDFLASRLTNKNQASFRLTQILEEPKETLRGVDSNVNMEIVKRAQQEEKLMQTRQDQLKRENNIFKQMLQRLAKKYELQ